MGLFSRKKQEPKLAPLEGDGSFAFHVVGESYYMDAIRSIIRSAPKPEQAAGRVTKLAVLLPEPDNKYDNRAIAVVIDGKKVGHVPKTDLDLLHEVVSEVKSMGFTYPAVQAALSWNASNGPEIVGVYYDLKYERTPLTPDQRPKPIEITGKSHQLKRGTEIRLSDVDEALVDKVRSTTEKQPRIGHVVEVALQLDAKGDVWAYLDGVPLGRMDPDMVGMYRDQFRKLSQRGEYGVTDAHIKWDGAKSSHAISLEYAREGIL